MTKRPPVLEVRSTTRSDRRWIRTFPKNNGLK